MNYENMTVAELRRLAGDKAKSEGTPTTEIKTQWSKADLVAYLTDGTKPERAGSVNIDDIGKQLAGLIASISGNGGVDEGAAMVRVVRGVLS